MKDIIGAIKQFDKCFEVCHNWFAFCINVIFSYMLIYN